jgi:thiol-disulfide isomerase/thioredoxin
VRRFLGILSVALALAAISVCAWPQGGILSFSPEPAVLEISPGGRAAGHITIENASPLEADDIEFTWAGSTEFALDPTPEGVAVLGAFATTSVGFSIAAANTAALGETRGSFEVIYTYCIGDVCYQIVESVPVMLRVAAAPQTPPAVAAGTADDGAAESPANAPWRWMAFALAALLVVPAVLLRREGRVRLLLTAALLVAGGAALGLGVSLGQHKQAQAVGAVLCTSCVGIETVGTLQARLSPSQAAAVGRITAPIELFVFYAPWCRACPYVEEMVALVAARNPLVHYRLVNAEVERDFSALYGVTRAGRTVVPAVVRFGVGDVLFGAENLGDRLVALLQEAP